jgi:dihydropteroate synthase
VDLVNDTWAGHDPQLARIAAEQASGYVISHTGGLAPRTDPVQIHYGDDSDQAVLDAVLGGLREGAARALAAGLPATSLLLDPTLDFGKTTRHSLALLRHTDAIVRLGYPVMMAASRKDFVGETLDLGVDQRLEGSLAAVAVAAWQGATVFRTHDVLATRRVVDMVAAIRGDRPPIKSARGG